MANRNKKCPNFKKCKNWIYPDSILCATCNQAKRDAQREEREAHEKEQRDKIERERLERAARIAEGKANPEDELREKVDTIQDRTASLIDRAAAAMTDMLDEIRAAEAAGASPEELAPLLDLQRQAMWRLDFISSENSLGLHADQEAARILGESIDYSRQAAAEALRLRAAEAPESERVVAPVEGVTNADSPPVESDAEATDSGEVP